ncbi:hypothetical protein F0Q34_21215 [Pseudoroseomonas oryzae]|uniref:Uncharacterized protein n=2 Tax=Teichococcus oryzae TaxID=1608942 RepID=A0A5B2TAH3_9PROT|nr:hypothetical protein F0Q34_21215 [Pseudoroseomonas oryzae]
MTLPHDDEALSLLHERIAHTLTDGLYRVGEVFELTFGKEAAHAAMCSLLLNGIGTGAPVTCSSQTYEEADRRGWKEYLDDLPDIEVTQLWRDGAEYAGQGIAPHEPYEGAPSLDDRRRRVEKIIAHGRVLATCAETIFGKDYLAIWEGVAARAAIDFGGSLTLEGIRLLSGVSLNAVRNAVSLGELNLDKAGRVSSTQAEAWLKRRREFCPSRWKNLQDNQAPFDRILVTGAGDRSNVLVPQDAEGTPFMPQHVVRPAKGRPGISITVGAKGSEEQHSDFFDALKALADMEVARWRRRNSAGNWGIVRARGPWVLVSKAEIERQLAAILKEAA